MHRNDKKPRWLHPDLIAPWRQVAAVMVLTTGYYVWTSTEIALHRGHSGVAIDFPHDNGSDLGLLFSQSATLAIFLYYLYWDGWVPRDLRINISWAATLHTIPLLFLEMNVALIGFAFMEIWAYENRDSFHPEQIVHLHSLSHYSWIVMFGGVVMDVLFEEITAMSYLFNQIAVRQGPVIASILVLAVRLACHTWKPPFMLGVTAVEFGIFCLWYWQTRNLWPIIITHVCFDVFWLYPEVR
jgi:membrane protease YdiL (CAAX protease family)